MPDPLEFARSLIEAGVPVLARPPGGTVDGFSLPERWQAATADPRTLEPWRPGWALLAVCGVQPGGGVDVIDLDPRNGGHLDALTCPLPPVVAMVATPGDDEYGTGLHLYVPAQGLGKGAIAPGIDYQAGTGVVGLNGKSDRGFVWLPGTERSSKAGRPGYEVVADLGAWPLGGAQVDAFKHWVTEARGRQAPRSADKGSLSGSVRVGGRDRDATSYAASLRRRGFSPEEAEASMTARWALYEQPAGDHFPLDAALAKLDTAWRAFEPREEPLGLAGFSVPQRHLVAVPDLTDGPEGFVRPEPRGHVFLDWDALESEPTPVVDWLVPGILAAGRGHLIYSATGQGKSLLTLEWVAGLAKAGRRVLYCDWENDPHGDVWARLTSMGFTAADLGNLRYLSFPALDPLDVSGAELVRVAVGEEVELVVLDTASRTIRGPENDNDTWNAWDRQTGIPLRKAGIGFVRLDHAGKDVERGARGGSAKGTDVDLVWRLELDDSVIPHVVTLTNEKPRVPVPDKVVQFNKKAEPSRHERVSWSPETIRLKKSALNMTQIWEAMDRLGIPEMTGRPTAKTLLHGHGIKGIDTNDLAAVIQARKLVYQGRMEVVPAWAPARYKPQGATTEGSWDVTQGEC